MASATPIFARTVVPSARRTPLISSLTRMSPATGVLLNIGTLRFINAFTKCAISAGPRARMLFFFRSATSSWFQFFWLLLPPSATYSSTVR